MNEKSNKINFSLSHYSKVVVKNSVDYFPDVITVSLLFCI